MGHGCSMATCSTVEALKNEEYARQRMSELGHQRLSLVGGKSGEPTSSILSTLPPQVRSDFITKVYSVLSVHMILTTLLAYLFACSLSKDWLMQHLWLHYAASLGIVLLVTGSAIFCQDALRVFPWSFAFLSVLSVLIGVTAGFFHGIYALPAVGMAAGSTAAIYCGMTAFCCTTRSDFSGTAPYFFVCSCGLFVIGLLFIFFDSDLSQKVYAGCAATLFSLYIVYDTQLIVGGSSLRCRYGVDDFVFAASGVYLDIFNVFASTLNLLGARSTEGR